MWKLEETCTYYLAARWLWNSAGRRQFMVSLCILWHYELSLASVAIPKSKGNWIIDINLRISPNFHGAPCYISLFIRIIINNCVYQFNLEINEQRHQSTSRLVIDRSRRCGGIIRSTRRLWSQRADLHRSLAFRSHPVLERREISLERQFSSYVENNSARWSVLKFAHWQTILALYLFTLMNAWNRLTNGKSAYFTIYSVTSQCNPLPIIPPLSNFPSTVL